jgi:hypothetical protein
MRVPAPSGNEKGKGEAAIEAATRKGKRPIINLYG